MKDKIIVVKIHDYISKIIQYCDGYDYDSFSKNSMLVEASVFNLSQIGELAKKISDELKTQYPALPWKQLYGLRNRIVHDYEGVNLKLVWDIIDSDLEELQLELSAIIKSM